MRSAGWSGSTTWQRSSGRRPPSTRPGPTVRSPSSLRHTHACARTAPPVLLGLFVRPLFLLLGDEPVRNGISGFTRPQAASDTLEPGPPCRPPCSGLRDYFQVGPFLDDWRLSSRNAAEPYAAPSRSDPIPVHSAVSSPRMVAMPGQGSGLSHPWKPVFRCPAHLPSPTPLWLWTSH